ncbi:MAG TPA: hypothetical protein VGK67_17530 [Myxococcales bacterium]|jgi:hypothetical protein
MRQRIAAILSMLALALPSIAAARPITRPFELKAGKEEFVKAWLKGAGTDDPSVATAEYLSSNEVLLTAVKPGRALLFLIGEASMDAIRLRIAGPDGKVPVVKATEEQKTAVRKACPGFKEEGSGDEVAVVVAVSSPACRAALRELFDCDEYSTRRIELSFSPEALFDQLQAIRAALKPAGLETIQVSYSGVTAVLKGKATRAQRMELMKVLYVNSVGPVLFEDQLEAAPEPKKAVPEEPPPTIEDVKPQAVPDAGAPAPKGKSAKK